MKKIREFIEKYHMITTGDRVIAGVSGGADSVCLFFALLELKKEIGFELVVVHVNHGLRGEAADRDEAFVRNLCEKYKIPLEVSSVQLESIAKKRKQSLEEAGRIVRREAFSKAMQKYDGTRIALAHHQNDNAETLLMNLARGTGLTGLGGIRPVNGVFIRPLLCLNRGEIEHFLKARDQDFCIDATNAETEYTRNRIRHLVVPVLEEQVNSQAIRHMNDAIEQIWELQDYMDLQARKAFGECVVMEKQAGETVCLIRDREWRTYPDILKKMIIRQCLYNVSGRTQDIGQVHVNAIAELFEKQSGRRLDLPYCVKAVRRYEGVQIGKIVCGSEEIRERIEIHDSRTGRNREKDFSYRKESLVKLQIPGETYLEDRNLRIECEIFPKKAGVSFQDIPQKPYTKWFDYDIIRKALFIRTRRSGDSIVIDKDGHRQKLKSWFINEKIPAEERENQLLIAEEDQVVWILGHRMSSAYQVSENTRKILQIRITEEKKDVRDN